MIVFEIENSKIGFDQLGLMTLQDQKDDVTDPLSSRVSSCACLRIEEVFCWYLNVR